MNAGSIIALSTWIVLTIDYILLVLTIDYIPAKCIINPFRMIGSSVDFIAAESR